MKVILVNPPNPDPPPAYFGPPYGLSLLGAILARAGVEVLGRDYDRVQPDAMLKDATALLRRAKPDLVGVSCQSSNRGAAAALVHHLKKVSPSLPVIVGGPFATTNPELLLRRTGADWVAVGDGEQTLPELVAAIAAGGDPRSVAGLVWSEKGCVRRAPERAAFTALDELPHPDFDLFDIRDNLTRYHRPRAEALACGVRLSGRRTLAMNSAIMVLSSRGCVYRCVFCPMSTFKGAPRLHSPTYFVRLVADLAKRYAWRDFVFGDNFFTRDRDRVLEICRLLRQEAPGIEWICMTRADAMDPVLAAAMSAAGCREISYGIETGSPRVQKEIGKRLDLDKVPEAFRITRRAGMNAVLMLMVGNPGDDMETTRETASFLRGIEPDRVLVNLTKVYPGTGLHATAEAAGVVSDDFYEKDAHEPPYYTVERTLEELTRMKALMPARTVYVETGAGCVNGCCSLRRPSAHRGLAVALSLAASRGERGVLGGGETLLIPGLGALLDDAQALGLYDLSFYTTGRPLVDARLVERLRLRRELRRLVIPLFSSDAARHDRAARVPGALAQTRLGMRNWARRSGELCVWVLPSEQDLPGLSAWVRGLFDDGVREVLLAHREPPPGWGGRTLASTPRLKVFAAAAAEAVSVQGEGGGSVSVFGLPACLWDGDPGLRHEPRSLYDETVAGRDIVRDLRLRREPLMAHGRACVDCALRDSCDGVRADYLARYGDGELRPVAAPAVARRGGY